MKEASGELSTTAIAVVAIAAVGVLFTTMIFPNIQGALLASQRCSSAFDWDCGANGQAQTCNCRYYLENGDPSAENQTVTCENPNSVNN